MSGRLWLRSPFESLRTSGKGCVPLAEPALDGDGALQGLRRRPEGGHETVAHCLHLGAAVGATAAAPGSPSPRNSLTAATPASVPTSHDGDAPSRITSRASGIFEA